MYKKVLVPLDGSKLAECVLPHVEALAKGCQAAAIHFVQVYAPFQIPPGMEAVPLKQAEIDAISARGKKVAEDYIRGWRRGLTRGRPKPRESSSQGP